MSSASDSSSPPARGLDARLVIDAIPALAWSSHPDGAVEFVNQKWHDYTGLSPEESYGWGWKAAVHSEDLSALLANWGGSPDLEVTRESKVRLRRSDGAFHSFLLRREPLHDETGAVVRWFGTGIDVEEGSQKEMLRVAEKRTLELIADGASLSRVL
ncbi:MAG TPA: PAS domain-containing protein, partial [Terriglobales bacterium]|nr:PAS domain-containing protein [Terriglobales bacterium]